MEKPFPKYYFVAGGGTMQKMIEEVNYYMEEDWLPIGSIVIFMPPEGSGPKDMRYFQTMAKFRDLSVPASDDLPQPWKWDLPDSPQA